MDRMLVVVFDAAPEGKAYEGKKTLLQLDGEGSTQCLLPTQCLPNTQMAPQR